MSIIKINNLLFMRTFLLTLLAVASIFSINAKKQKLYVNSDITTHIILPEKIKLVDLSTPYIIGNQCNDNILRIKPSEEPDSIGGRQFCEGDLLGTVTIIGERHLCNYEVIFTRTARAATNIYNVTYDDLQLYNNPEVSMPKSEMTKYAWAVYASKRKFNNITSKANGIRAVVNNIYSIDNYFFIDYSLYNDTKIYYDIDEVRVKLCDKKETKATNSQTIELTPIYSLNDANFFKKQYRNVLVLDKLTFPEEKVLKIEISENQISGRVISLTIDYSDLLNADGFDTDIIDRMSPTFLPKYKLD